MFETKELTIKYLKRVYRNLIFQEIIREKNGFNFMLNEGTLYKKKYFDTLN